MEAARLQGSAPVLPGDAVSYRGPEVAAWLRSLAELVERSPRVGVVVVEFAEAGG